MHISAGLDIGSGAVKAVVMRNDGEAGETLITHVSSRIRRRVWPSGPCISLRRRSGAMER